MHAILGTVFLCLSSLCFAGAFLVFRKIRISERRFGNAVSTSVALVWTTFSALALVEFTKSGLDWQTEIISLGLGFLSSLGAVCVVALSISAWLVNRSRAV
jgi:hypothetical protein